MWFNDSGSEARGGTETCHQSLSQIYSNDSKTRRAQGVADLGKLKNNLTNYADGEEYILNQTAEK